MEKEVGLTRREFLKAVAVLGLVPLLPKLPVEVGKAKEKRSFYVLDENRQVVPDSVFVDTRQRLEVTKKGLYQVSVRVAFEPGLEGNRALQIIKGNQVLVRRMQRAEAALTKGVPDNELYVSTIFQTTEEELRTVQVQVYQNSGRNLLLEKTRLVARRL